MVYVGLIRVQYGLALHRLHAVPVVGNTSWLRRLVAGTDGTRNKGRDEIPIEHGMFRTKNKNNNSNYH